jgi:hypothetical protein
MAFTCREPYIVEQAIATNSTTQTHDLGTIVRAYDSTYGQGEFIYLKGVASTVVGSIVEYNTSWQTGLSTTATSLATPHPLAVAMSACVASEFGWYQISGESVMVKDSGQSFAVDIGVEASAGKAVLLASGAIINGAIVAVVASAKSDVLSVRVMINRPHGPSDVS